MITDVTGLTNALSDASVSHIFLAAGVYTFSGDMAGCSQSALCVNRNVTIEAVVPGTVLLNAQGSLSINRRVMTISSGTIALIGLKITGGYSGYVVGVQPSEPI